MGQRRREWLSFEPTLSVFGMDSRNLLNATFHKKNNICIYRGDMSPNVPCIPSVPYVLNVSFVPSVSYAQECLMCPGQMCHVSQMLQLS